MTDTKKNTEKTTKPAAEEAAGAKVKFAKAQLLAAKKFQNSRDITAAVLSGFPDDATFTIEAVEEMINKYMKRQVK